MKEDRKRIPLTGGGRGGEGGYHGDNFFGLSGRTIAVQVKTDKEQKIMQKGFVGSKEEMQKVKRELKNSPHWRGAGTGNRVYHGDN